MRLARIVGPSFQFSKPKAMETLANRFISAQCNTLKHVYKQKAKTDQVCMMCSGSFGTLRAWSIVPEGDEFVRIHAEDKLGKPLFITVHVTQCAALFIPFTPEPGAPKEQRKILLGFADKSTSAPDL